MLRNFFFKNIIISTLRDVYRLLLPSQRLRALKLIVLILFGSLVDVIGLASIIPVMFMALDTSVIDTNIWIKSIYDSFGFESKSMFLFCTVILLLLFYIIKNIISILIIFYQSRFCYGVATNLSIRQFISYYSRGYLFFRHTNSNEIFRDIDIIPSGYSVAVMLPLLLLISESIVLFIIILSLSMVKIELFVLLIMLLVPAFILPFQLLKEKVHRSVETYTQMIPFNNSALLQGIFGYVDAKLSGKEEFVINKYIKNKSKMNSLQAQLYTMDSIPVKLIELITIFGVVIIFTYTLFWGNERKELITLLSLFSAAAFRIMPSMSRILNSLMKIKGWKDTNLILQNLENINIVNVKKELILSKFTFSKHIVFENISFSYSDTHTFVLKNINLTINKGETVGFIGKSGSGKSTLMNILLRFLIEQEGKIRVDNISLTHEITDSWRCLLGYVKQDIYLIEGSLLENIAYGVELSEIDFKKVEKSISMAILGDFVSSLPEGIHTQIGEYGNKISGGQKQRIGIARALYKEAEILILDEATNQLDSQTENEITESIEKLSQIGITILIIAHRLSTLKNCHRIYEMNNGEINNYHTYKDLVEYRMK